MQVYRTDQDGAVWIDADIRDQKITVHTSRERKLQRVRRDAPVFEQELTNLGRLWDFGLGYT